MTANPTAPRPKTATDEPVSTLHVFQTAPQPVATPQPRRHILWSGASVGTLAQEISATTVYSEKVEQPIKSAARHHHRREGGSQTEARAEAHIHRTWAPAARTEELFARLGVLEA